MILAGVIAMSLLSCDGIYDDPDDFPFLKPSRAQSYQFVDCTNYTTWVYLNLHKQETLTLDYREPNVPMEWDLAMHRYDVKTNGGSGLETSYTSLDEFQSDVEKGLYGCPDESLWVSDVDDSITIDVSHMLEGYLVNVPAVINLELTKWLNVNISTMPPIYIPSNKVYLLRLSDSSVAAIRFMGFANPMRDNAKGYISFDYIYPVTFTK